MNRLMLCLCLAASLLLAACGGPEPTPALGPGPNAPPPVLPTFKPGAPLAGPTLANPDKTNTPPRPEKNYCPGGGAVVVGPADKLAAKVNGQGIPLALFQRQSAQAQAAFVAQGIDPNSQQGKENLAAIQVQVLDQLIADVLIEQAARKENVQVPEYDVNARIQALINDANGMAKFEEYLKTNQLQMGDLCTQMRAQMFGELMLARVAASLPTAAEQVRAAHILFATEEDARKLAAAAKTAPDFGALAKQYSQDVATKDNGGDLGWFPRGVMDPQIEEVAFKLNPGQVSDPVVSGFGVHIVKVLEKNPARPLPAELLQSQRQQAFLNWLEEQRKAAQVEKYVNP